ncbi:MAG: histidine phosphatase family protein [Micrococcales bacterium]|nr:histidine phosphatase family protein [Micrococcales bacterium]
MTELYLVRHGETDWNVAKRIQGATDIPLNGTGRAQARTAGRLLSRRSWDGVYTSPLSRARETAELIAAEIGAPAPRAVAELVERNYGEAEGLSWQEIERRFPEGVRVPGRESREAVALRVAPALLRLADAHPGESLVIVSHGGAIRSVLNAVDPGSRFGMITNGSVHSFRVFEGSLQLIAFDDPIEEESIGPDCGDIDDQNALEHRDANVR